MFLGWGNRPSGKRARYLSGLLGDVSLTLEDGFLTPHYVDLPADGKNILSLYVDRVGAHYNAFAATELENTILGTIEDSCLKRAEEAIERICRTGLSRYNFLPELTPAQLSLGSPFVLLIDQVSGDLSISYGGASEDSFSEMLEAALDENPGHSVIIRGHPANKGNGPLEHAAKIRNRSDRLLVLAESCALWPLLREASRLYTVSSHSGFEALLAGVPVTCFGVPFYAGWGHTDDRVACQRRSTSVSIPHIFAASYIKHSRYFDTQTNLPSTLEAVLGMLESQKASSNEPLNVKT